MHWRETRYGQVEHRRLYLYDDFNRADTTEPDLGTAVRGGKWLIANESGVAPGRYGCIRSGYATSSRQTRDGQFVLINERGPGAAPTILFAEVRWALVPNGLSYSGWMSMGCTNEQNACSGANGLHIAVRRSRCDVRIRKNGVETFRKQQFFDPQLSVGIHYLVIADINAAAGTVTVSINGLDLLKVQTGLVGQVLGATCYWQACYDSYLKATAELAFKELGASIDPPRPSVPRKRDTRWVIAL